MDHPNLIRFLGGKGEPPQVYLVTEIVENGSLWDLLRDKKRGMPWHLRARVALGTALRPVACAQAPHVGHHRRDRRRDGLPS